MHQPHWRAYYFDLNPQDPDSADMLVRKLTLPNLNFHQNGSLHGNGNHHQLGNFNIAGTHAPNKEVKFTLTYPDRVLYFDGRREDNSVVGTWAHDPQYQIGSFKFTWVTPKQGWNGTYSQDDIDYDMNFQEFNIDYAPNGKLTAKGEDINGEFEFEGVFDVNTNQARFEKIYDNHVAWKYWGNVNNNVIEGQWGFNEGEAMGKFHLFRV